jgi:outer membrane biosynthesis protein TonB
MSVASSVTLSMNALPGMSLFFAKEPSSAGDPTQADMDKTVVLGPPGKKGPTPPSTKERILFLVLVLIIVGGGGYLAVNPEVLMNLLGDAPGDTPPPLPRPRVAKPVAPVPTQAPVSAPAQPAAPEAGPVPVPAPPQPPAMAPPVPAAPASAPVPVAPTAPPAVPTAAAPTAAPKPPTSSAAPDIPTPRFGEGEKVSVSALTPLTADSAGKKPGMATAAPGSTLVVLDADLQNYAWVYSVRTEQGVTGWIAEKNLVAK